MSLIVKNLAEICSSRLLDEKWLIAPSLSAGRQWLDRVTRTGRPVINVRIRTVSGLAIELAKPQAAKRGFDLLTSQAGIIIVDGILNKAATTDPGYFSKLPASLSLAERIYYSIRDLRLAGLDHRNLASGPFEHKEKGEEIARILREYCRELAGLNLVDYADAVELARESLAESAGMLAGGSLVLLPEDIGLDLSPKEKELLDSIPAGNKLFLEVDTADKSPHEPPIRNAHLLRWVLDPSKAPAAQPGDTTVSIFTAAGEMNEVREVFRSCLRNGIPLDEVELLYTDGDTYVPLIYELAMRLKQDTESANALLVAFDEGIPASYSRPGKALAAWASWVGEGFLQSTLVKMLEERLLTIPGQAEPFSGELLMPGLLRSAKIGLGRERYLPALEGLVERCERKLLAGTEINPEDEERQASESREHMVRKAEAARCLLELVKGLPGTCPLAQVSKADEDPSVHAEDPRTVRIDTLKLARVFLESFVRVSNDMDEAARHGLINEIREMQRLLGRWDSVNIDILQWVASLPRQVRVMASSPKPGAIFVAGADKGGHSGRKHLFIVGLDDGRFPGAGAQDPVILDSEREALSHAFSARLPTAKGSLSLKLKRFADLLARVSGTVTLSYSSKDIVDDREMFPSPPLLSAHRIISGDRNADLNQLLNSLPAAAAFASSDLAGCLDSSEWWLNQLCSARVVEDREVILRSHFPHPAKGLDAARRRESPEFTIYDGRVMEPDESLDPTAEAGPRLSASSLETIGACPRRYFFRYVLGIELPEDVAVDKETWLDPAEFGTLLHEVLYEFVSQRLKTGWPPAFPEDLEFIGKIAADKCENERRQTPTPSEAAFCRQRDELLQACRVFLAHESQQKDRKPVYLEACIGLDGRFRKGTPLDTAQPVSVELPNRTTVRVGGRIDRIDRLCGTAAEEYLLCDYKSGSAFKYRSADLFWSGRVVQHGLYVEMARKVLRDLSPGSSVKRFAYFFPGVAERGLLISYEPDDLAETPAVLQQLCSIPALGAFLSTSDPTTDCTYCDYTLICGDVKTIKTQTSAKMDNPAEVVLRPISELRNRDPKKPK